MGETDRRIGDYEVLGALGAGGMGRVFKVRNVISNREEAMKILLPDFASDPDLAARFMAEIRTLATLDHPGIAQLRTAFQYQNQFVMVMEYVEGTTLEKLAAQARIPVDKTLDYSSQVLAALSYAHSRGVTHRDIKPSNIMITTHGLVKLMDFGIAKSTNDMQLTRPGTTMGSVYYMSPEQVRGGTIDARSDLYSFGVTLYEMLTGQRPFQADTSYSVLNAQLNQAPKPLVEINPAISPVLNNIVLHAMEKLPEQRFQTADEFRNALKTVHEPQPARIPAAVMAAPAVVQAVGQAQQAAAMPQFAAAPPQDTTATQPPAYTPVAPPAGPPPAAAKTHRGLWIGLGAATAILALVAVAAVLPRILSTHASQKTAAVTSDPQGQTPAPAPTAQPQAPSPADATGQPVAPATADTSAAKPAPPSDASAQPAASSSGDAPEKPSPAKGPSRSVKPAKMTTDSSRPRETYVSSREPTPTSGSAPDTGSAIASPVGPSLRDMREARDRLGNLESRADSALAGVEQIRKEQQAQGVDIRGDILSSMNRLHFQLNESRKALNERDLATANEYMNRADLETSRLEKFLGH
jgi:hypothetical protein